MTSYDWDGFPSRFLWADANPDSMDRDGMATLIYPGMGKARVRYGHPSRASHLARRRNPERRAARLRRAKRLRVNEARAKQMLDQIDRDIQIAEIERLLDEMAAAGEIVKNPDGTFQAKPPSLIDKLHARRKEARHGES